MFTIQLRNGNLNYNIKEDNAKKNENIETICFDTESDTPRYEMTSYEANIRKFLNAAKLSMTSENFYNFLLQFFNCKDYTEILYSLEPICDEYLKKSNFINRTALTIQKNELFNKFKAYPNACSQAIAKVYLNQYVLTVLNIMSKEERYKLCNIYEANKLTNDLIIDFFANNIDKDSRVFPLAKFLLMNSLQVIINNLTDHKCFNCQSAYTSKCIKIAHREKDLINNYTEDPGISDGIQVLKSNISDEELLSLIESGKITSIFDEKSKEINLISDKLIVSNCNSFCLDYGTRKK